MLVAADRRFRLNRVLSLGFGVFLQQHCIGAGRKHGAGEYPHRFAFGDAGVKRMARRRAPDHAQPFRARAVEAPGTHGVAVHGRCVERRQIDRRRHVLGGNAAERSVEFDLFALGHRPRKRTELLDGQVDG